MAADACALRRWCVLSIDVAYSLFKIAFVVVVFCCTHCGAADDYYVDDELVC